MHNALFSNELSHQHIAINTLQSGSNHDYRFAKQTCNDKTIGFAWSFPAKFWLGHLVTMSCCECQCEHYRTSAPQKFSQNSQCCKRNAKQYHGTKLCQFSFEVHVCSSRRFCLVGISPVLLFFFPGRPKDLPGKDAESTNKIASSAL